MNYYLLKVVKAPSGLKLRIVEGQVDDEGETLDPSLNVNGATDERKKLGEGGLLITDQIINRGKYYSTGKFFAVNAENAKLTELPEAPDEAKVELDEFLGGVGTPTKPARVKEASVPKDSLLSELLSDEKYAVPTVEETGFYVDKDIWYLLARNVKRGISTMLYGPSGTGKTELIDLLAESLDLSIEIFDMGSCLDPTATLIGVHRLHEGKSVFDFSRFYEAVQKPGIILLDELSRAPENTANLLLPCLDSRRTLYTEISSSEIPREVPIHEDCIFMATANIGSEYVGANLLDKALLSRFFKMELDYLNAKQEISVIVDRCGIEEDDASLIVKICGDIRKSYREGILSKDVSTRESLAIAEMAFDGFPLQTAMSRVLLPCFEGDGGVEGGERHTVQAKILAI